MTTATSNHADNEEEDVEVVDDATAEALAAAAAKE
jgi:hypothetical protein